MIELYHMSKKTNNRNLPANYENLTKELGKAGMTNKNVANMLLDLCSWTSSKIDKNGNVHESIDGALRLRALELWAKITGSLAPGRSESKNLKANVDLNELSDQEMKKLEKEANFKIVSVNAGQDDENRENTEKSEV